MASWDTPVVNAPSTANYGAPVQDFSSVANLLQDFVKGRQAGREEEKAAVFRNGIPKVGGSTDPNAPIDVGAVTDKLARINPDYAMPLINMQLQGDIGRQAGKFIQNGGQPDAPQPSGSQPSAAPSSSRPAIAPAPYQPSAAPQGDQPGSIMSVLSDAGIPNTELGNLAGRFAAMLKVDQNAALSPDQKAAVIKRLEPIKSQIGAVVQPGASLAQPQQVAQAAPDNPGWGQADADALSQRATRLNAYAAALANVNPKAAEAVKAEAAATEARAKQIRDYISGEDTSTPDQKNYNSDKLPGESMAGYQARAAGGQELAKQDSIAYSKKYEGIQKAAVEASVEQDKIKLMKTFANSPDFYSGIFEPTNRTFKQFAVAFGPGIDPNKVLPQEGFNKVASDMLTSQIRALGASGAGPVRIAEVKNMQKSIANLGITPVTNRLLVEITDRTYKDVQAIADLTRKYEGDPNNRPGKMNVGLDQKIHDYYEKHPLFNEAEIKDPRLIAPPEFKDSRAAFNAKLPLGTPVKIGGKLLQVK